MAVAYFQAGQASVAASDTLVIPITADVPRSDPVAGGTLIYVFIQVPSTFVGGITAVTDDATPQDAYSLCVFSDGLNHYTNGSQIFGLIVNDLANGVNNITVQLTGTAGFIAGIALAITGANVDTLNAQSPSPTWLFDLDPAHPMIGAEKLGGGPISPFPGAIFASPTGPVQMVSPPGVSTDQDWAWVTNSDYAFYVCSDVSSAVDEGGWTWADGSIFDFTQWDIDSGLGSFFSMALGVQTAPTPLAAGPSFDGAWGNAGSKFFTGIAGFAVTSGPGPACVTPPPGGGVPIFNNHIRLSE